MAHYGTLTGINAYPGAPLSGCKNDIADARSWAQRNRGWSSWDFATLTDSKATTRNILNERLPRMVRKAKGGDVVLFWYSGHGAPAPTYTPDLEPDGLDEVICPVDFDWSDEHMIRDKQLIELFKQFAPGVRLFWVSDSCHSGGMTRDINPHAVKYKVKPRAYPNIPMEIGFDHEKLSELSIVKSNDLKDFVTNKLECAFISGCRSDQTSADAYFNNRPNGALTYYLLDALRRLPVNTSVADVVAETATSLARDGFDQVPQAEGSLINKPFLA